ncbi:chitobiase/beta-hexosaminidase C-terminal domain-containing protein, partial [bacterium]|nr:chitobiase/beta-hexosaminidase C-terminal domain-containing protein [bacterium]
IEIENTSGVTGDLGGWFLTDDPLVLTKWQFPAVEVMNGARLIVFASEKDRDPVVGELHTNFRLQSSAGGYLALVKPDGTTIASEFTDYPEQFTDISYSGQFYPTPTPGEANGTSVTGITLDTKFSMNRGLYDAPISLVISTLTDGATIRYTTNGSIPSENSGIIYNGPISVAETTIVRAIAYKDRFLSTNVDTHTYLFPADVVNQPEMRTAITQNATYGPQMVDALISIPSISLTFAGNDVDRTEIPTSVELLNFEGESKQVNAGVVRFGGAFTDFAKRSIRLHFRSAYGPSRLKFPLYDGHDYKIPPVENFDALDLRAGNHDMVARGAYLSNRFTDDSMLDMGQIAPHGRFVHLYFNGNYRGQYHVRERWAAAMLASYFPGSEEEFDTINANNAGREFLTGESQDGDLIEWNQIRSSLTGNNPYDDVKDLLDVGNLIDFMLLWTGGQSESEFRAGGSSANNIGFKFMIKDADGFLRNSIYDVTHNGPLNAMTRFRNEGNSDFNILLADRAHKHLFNDGALTAVRMVERLQKRVDEVSLSYLGEIARWGSHNGQTNRNPVQWLAYQNNVLNNILPNFGSKQLTKLRNAGLYPDLIAPVFSQHGGSIPSGAGITMSTGETTIYYTLDGSDPRQSEGAPAAGAISAPFAGDVPIPEDFITSGNFSEDISGSVWSYLDDGSDQGTAWRASRFDDSSWESGPSQLGYNEGDEATRVDFVDVAPDTPGNQRNATTYFRTKVIIPDPASFSHFDLKLLYDDGAAVYINGMEAVRTANLVANAAFDEYASSGTPDESAFFNFTIPTSSFVNGENTIAVEIHNSSAGSSDISFDLSLRGEVDPSAGTNVTEPVILSSASQLSARSYNSSTEEWSALTTAFFSIDTVPASAENLVISEIHYHPSEPTAAEEIAISTDRDDYEFIELLNISAQNINLTGVHFSTGIGFTFADNTILAAGARIVLVKDPEAFAVRYGNGVAIGGEYSGNLSNSDDFISLSLTGVGALHSLSYTDDEPWPTQPDGSGYSIILLGPSTNPDSALPENWGTHSNLGGGPGIADMPQVESYQAWATMNGVTSEDQDLDQDGLSALLEYALGTDPSVSNPDAVQSGGVVGGFSTISFQRGTGRSDVIFQVQSSADLISWTDEQSTQVSPDLYRIDSPIAGTAKRFLRLKVTLN